MSRFQEIQPCSSEKYFGLCFQKTRPEIYYISRVFPVFIVVGGGDVEMLCRLKNRLLIFKKALFSCLVTLVVVIYLNVTLQVDQHWRNIFCLRLFTCNVTFEKLTTTIMTRERAHFPVQIALVNFLGVSSLFLSYEGSEQTGTQIMTFLYTQGYKFTHSCIRTTMISTSIE